ncbi:cytochrome C oxidase subunit IV family protein [Ekhidna sp.]|uniref:cytochrome C oxidase subunit IV family protein n=1 Tax=Ekhidna sp. TaxID=2608089 RepID=UPI0032EB308E
MEQQTPQVEVKPVDKAKVKNFLKVMWYLALITAVEFGIAFTVPHEHKWIRIIVFIALTIVKAYYIVSEFMHLGHEKKSLKMSIVLPMLFVVFFIFIMIYQGGAILEVLY